MRTRLTFLLLTGACTALSAFTSLAPRVGEGVSGTQGAGADVAIDGDDIGGVVTGPKGPEAGVWVIAETTDLPTKFVRIVVTDDRGRYLVPDLPKANYQSGCAATGSWTRRRRRRRRERALDLKAVTAPTRAPRRTTTPPATGTRCSRCPARASSRARARAATASSRTITTQAAVRPRVEVEADACRAISWARRARARSRPAWARSPRRSTPGTAASQSGQAGAQMVGHAQPARRMRTCTDVRRLDRSHRGRRGAARAAAPAGSRAQRRHHPVGLGRPEALSARRGLDRQAQPDGSTPTARFYGALELSADYMPVLDPVDAHRESDSADGARPGDAGHLARHGSSRRRTGAASRSGPARTTSTTRCWTRRARLG